MVLDSGGNVPAGSPLKQWTNNGSGNLQFTVAPAAARAFAGTYAVVAQENGLSWDDDSTTAGSPVVQNTPTTDPAQRWTFQPTDSGYFRIVNKSTGRVIESASPQQGAAVTVADVSEDPGQQWKPVAVGSTWVFQNRVDAAIVLDSGGRVPAGSPLKQWTDNGSANFRFTLTEVEPGVDIAVEGGDHAYGTDGSVTVRVTGTDGTPGGTVAIVNGAAPIAGPVALVDGTATLTIPGDALPVGTSALQVRYAAEAPYSDTVAGFRATITEPTPTPTSAATPTPTGQPSSAASSAPVASPGAVDARSTLAATGAGWPGSLCRSGWSRSASARGWCAAVQPAAADRCVGGRADFGTAPSAFGARLGRTG